MNQHQSTSISISINQNQSAWSNSCTFLIILCCTFGSTQLTLLFCFLQIWFVLRLLLKCEKGASSSSSSSSSAQIKEFPADAGDCLRISRIKKYQKFVNTSLTEEFKTLTQRFRKEKPTSFSIFSWLSPQIVFIVNWLRICLMYCWHHWRQNQKAYESSLSLFHLPGFHSRSSFAAVVKTLK